MKSVLYKIYRVLPVSIRWPISYFLSSNFSVGVTAFIPKGKKILLLKNTYQNYWALPGGFLKKSETFAHAIEREIEEETGIIVKMDRILAVKTHRHKKLIDIVVVCKILKGKIKLDKVEVKSAKFFDLKDLPGSWMPDFQIEYIHLYKTESGLF